MKIKTTRVADEGLVPLKTVPFGVKFTLDNDQGREYMRPYGVWRTQVEDMILVLRIADWTLMKWNQDTDVLPETAKRTKTLRISIEIEAEEAQLTSNQLAHMLGKCQEIGSFPIEELIRAFDDK